MHSNINGYVLSIYVLALWISLRHQLEFKLGGNKRQRKEKEKNIFECV